MGDSALKTIFAGKVRRFWLGQHADTADEITCIQGLALIGADTPALSVTVPVGGGDAGFESIVFAQLEFIGDEVQVALNLCLGRKALGPIPLLNQLVGEPVLVDIGLSINARTGVAVPVPGATHCRGRFDAPHA